ncbi:MAG: prolipoprotein diacylglyceryl transferase [Actinomycetaceae bacterium]|nr:prolipoprotein diacylglyceryl transferase [Actinomycetaceae bacterium]
MSIRAAIDSPSESVWHLGPVPLRAYALAIICGIVVAWVVLARRYRARSGPVQVIPDIMVVMVISGIVGGRLYHVITDYDLYFGPGRDPISALYVWEGGLGIWGAITLGGVGAYLACRHYGLRLGPFGDAIAPALLLAQAIGRLGNYFNQELYGRPTDLPWALRIDYEHLLPGYEPGQTFHPTFLYELLWCAVGALVLMWLDRRFKLRGGQVFACYVMIYTSGRVWIEYLRIDTARQILGLRLNVWVSIVVFVGAALAFLLIRRRLKTHPEIDDIWVSDQARRRFEARFAGDDSDEAEDAGDVEGAGSDDGKTGRDTPKAGKAEPEKADGADETRSDGAEGGRPENETAPSDSVS